MTTCLVFLNGFGGFFFLFSFLLIWIFGSDGILVGSG